MPLSRARQAGPHCRQAARITSVSRLGGEAWPSALQLGAHLAEIVDFAIVGDGEPAVGRDHRLGAALEVDDRQPAVAEADAGRGPDPAAVRARDGRATSAIARIRAGSTGLGTSGWKMPAMPHISAPLAGRRRGRQARSTAPSARRNASIAGRALPCPAGSSAETRTATARCGPPSRCVFIVSSFTCAGLPVRIVADAVEARHLAHGPVREDPFGLAAGRRRRVGGPGPGAARLGGALAEADQLPPRFLTGEDGDGEIDLLARPRRGSGRGEAVGAGEMRLPRPAASPRDLRPARHVRHRERRLEPARCRPRRSAADQKGAAAAIASAPRRRAPGGARVRAACRAAGGPRDRTRDRSPCGRRRARRRPSHGDDDGEEDPAVEDMVEARREIACCAPR